MAEKKKAEGPIWTLEQFAKRTGVNPGYIASFKYEAEKAGDDLAPRAVEEWEKAIEAQKKRKY